MSVPLFSALFRMFKILHNKSLFKLNCKPPPLKTITNSKSQGRAVCQEEVTWRPSLSLSGEVGGGSRLLGLQGRGGRHREEEERLNGLLRGNQERGSILLKGFTLLPLILFAPFLTLYVSNI